MNLRFRIGFALAAVVILGFFALANFVPQSSRLESPILPAGLLRLGLDLQGGIHWVLGAKLDVAEEQELAALRNALADFAEDGEVRYESARLDARRLLVEVADARDAEAVRDWARGTQALAADADDDTHLSFRLLPDVVNGVRQRGMDQVLEVLRRRIGDPIRGIPDSVVTRQGQDRILVQIPGGQIDRTRAGELLEITGHLEFKIAHDQDQSVELLEARYAEGFPEDQVVGLELDKETDRVVLAYLLDAEPAITGDFLTDARVSFDRQQRPIVEFQFNREGARKFAEFTAENVGQNLAIVLDERVYSAPVIRSRIGARGQIEGRFTSQEAADLAVVLRSGSLPIPVEIEEERTVGPALGADSIRRGLRASVVGLALIVTMVCAYYRMSGLYASLALIANLLMLMGIMSLFKATLTLPGIAGIVLTVGMAVDANVIIFERIREEIRSSKTPRAAINTGFNKAIKTILDANVTTLITALVLFEYGTGPIKGFAVTLSVGILTSVFAALVLTRLMFNIYPGNRPVESLSI